MGILETFPFSEVMVEVWFIEHQARNDSRKHELNNYDPQFVEW